MKVSVIQIALVANDSSIQIALVAISFCITTIIMDVLGKMKMTVSFSNSRKTVRFITYSPTVSIDVEDKIIIIPLCFHSI